MAFLFDPVQRSEVIQRLHGLHPEVVPQWGKMSVAQMLAHCAVPFRLAKGEVRIGRSFIGRLFGRMAKKKFFNTAPFSHNLPTDKKFLIAAPGDFEVARIELVALVSQFGEDGPDAVTCDVHPFFGPMDAADWDLLMWKHLDHHLRQFGV